MTLPAIRLVKGGVEVDGHLLEHVTPEVDVVHRGGISEVTVTLLAREVMWEPGELPRGVRITIEDREEWVRHGHPA